MVEPLLNERLEVEGLDDMSADVRGRAAGMGEPSATVVVAAIGALEPGLVAAGYDRGPRAVNRDAVLAARQDGAVASLGELLGDVRERAGEVADVLLAACDGVDGAGRPLFSGLRSLPRPADELGRLCEPPSWCASTAATATSRPGSLGGDAARR